MADDIYSTRSTYRIQFQGSHQTFQHDLIWKARKQSAKEFEKRFHATIQDFDFSPGQFVLVRNSQLEMDLARKWKPRYLGPYVVITRNSGGTYTLAELDGTISKHRVAAKRVIPFFLRSTSLVPDSSTPLENVNQEE